MVARVERFLGNLAGIDAAARQLEQMDAAPALQQKVQFERAEYYNNFHQRRSDSIVEYDKVINAFPGVQRSQAAAQARVRIADLIPADNFHTSMDLYRQTRDDSAAPAALQAWSALNLAYLEFQVRDEAAAAATLQRLISQKGTPAAYKAKAEAALKALREPESVENAQLRFDRATRCRTVNHSLDIAFFDYRSVVRKLDNEGAKTAAAEEIAKLPVDQQAQWRYKVAFGLFMTGYGPEAYEMCEEILADYQPTDITKWQCLYMLAFLKGRVGHNADAAASMRSIIDSCPIDEITQNAYMELVRLNDIQGDKLGAVLTLEELRVRFPLHYLAGEALAFQKNFYRYDPTLAEGMTNKRAPLVAKWGGRAPSLPFDDPNHNPQTIASDAITVPTGGAQ